jgi:replication fork clamp-binding protein CrfC
MSEPSAIEQIIVTDKNRQIQLQVENLLHLCRQEPKLSAIDVSAIHASLAKVISPTFEIVFAGAFSAGKSMLINALLERELLYSAEGHATGTQCYISYAEPDRERVILTFLSETEIHQQIGRIIESLGLDAELLEDLEALPPLCQQIIEQEGGESRSEQAKQAKSLILLLQGWVGNRDRILVDRNNSVTMAEFNFDNIQEAADFARRGKNSSVLKKIEYYCHHPLLQDGNVIVDTPGIDAPIKEDAWIAFTKVANPDTSAVICVFKTASTGELTTEETQLLELIQNNQSIRDRVFNTFNRIDETWYNTQLRQRLEYQIDNQFIGQSRIYRTSGLLGFYGSQIKRTSHTNRFGLDTIFAETVKGLNGKEETPQFVNEFVRYCLTSEKLSPAKFPIVIDPREAPTNNDKYCQILNTFGSPLIDQLIADSGIEHFRTAISHYLTTEKRPQLFASLAEDLQPVCANLRQYYQNLHRELDSQPREIGQMRDRQLQRLGQDLKEIGAEFKAQIDREISEIINGTNNDFDRDFLKLKARMVSCLDELINTFSVSDTHRRITNIRNTPRRNTVVPVLSILAEAFYYLANELESVLIAAVTELVKNYFASLRHRITKADYYRKLYTLIGNDGGIETSLNDLEQRVIISLVNQAQTECNRYVRETPDFYADGSASMWQLRQTLQQTCQSYDCDSMVAAEPAIRQLLQLDFEPKVSQTINLTFRSTIEQTLNTTLSPLAQEQADLILDRYEVARNHLGENLAREAQEKIDKNQQMLVDLSQKIDEYNHSATTINECLATMKLYRYNLPTIDRVALPKVTTSELPTPAIDFAQVN